jgi:hypothetical protein
MKRITAMVLVAIANFAMAGTSFAQSNGVRATVPFDFTVGDKLLPSGTYTLQQSSSHTIMIRNHDKPISVFSIVNQSDHRAASGGKLLFHRYGDRYFLSDILCDRANLDVQVPPSRAEKKTRLQQAALSSSSQVYVAAR